MVQAWVDICWKRGETRPYILSCVIAEVSQRFRFYSARMHALVYRVNKRESKIFTRNFTRPEAHAYLERIESL